MINNKRIMMLSSASGPGEYIQYHTSGDETRIVLEAGKKIYNGGEVKGFNKVVEYENCLWKEEHLIFKTSSAFNIERIQYTCIESNNKTFDVGYVIDIADPNNIKLNFDYADKAPKIDLLDGQPKFSINKNKKTTIKNSLAKEKEHDCIDKQK